MGAVAQIRGRLRAIAWAGLIAVGLLGPGCATEGAGSASTLAGETASGYAGPARDRVLWQYRSASTALRRSQYGEAKRLLDEALARLGGIFDRDRGSSSARGYFKAEAKKTFLGEPYERAMAYYYRGILYWMDGEPDNARACFRSAQFQDADAEEKSYAGDYVLLDYLDGLASAKLKGDGADAYQRARASCRMAIPPEGNPQHNVLFFIEYGDGPTKYGAGEYGEQLKFREGHSAAREVRVRVGDQAAHVGPYDDLNYQAMTRGGRVMDHVLGNKAVFKATTDAAGNAALVGGAILAGAGAGQHNAADEVGAGLMVAGLLSKIVSAATVPRADTRCWESLPLYLSFTSFQLAPGSHTATVEFLDEARAVVGALTKTVTFTVIEGGRDVVIYVSDKSATTEKP